jgi:hypothetical protein
MKCWGPDGRELFSTYSTSPAQIYTSFYGLARGGEQPFPELAGRQIFVTATARNWSLSGLDMLGATQNELNISVDYSNGWPLVRWGGWSEPTALQFAFYVFTL